jgi:hypothetical protein
MFSESRYNFFNCAPSCAWESEKNSEFRPIKVRLVTYMATLIAGHWQLLHGRERERSREGGNRRELGTVSIST